MAKKLSTKPRVYSYLRFSRPEQSEGDSERRQVDKARAYAKHRGLEFDEGLTIADRGLSGFHGTHRKKGALGVFLASVAAGNVPRGSTLVVENIDRLSREEFLTAIDTIKNLIQAGIDIHTISPEMTYTLDSINGGAIYQLVGQLQAAHGESKKKSERLSEAWAQKRKLARESGKPLTNMKPAWLNLDNGKFTVIPEAAKVIRSIFTMKLKGHGVYAIESRLNESGAWHVPKNAKRKTVGWRSSYIQKILRDRSLLGEYQPHRKVSGKRIKDGDPIENYFPAVVRPEVFHSVQEQLAKNVKTGGRNGVFRNLFTNLVRCGYCGGPMHYVDKSRPTYDWRYLSCDNARRRSSCEPSTIRYAEVEALLLDNCPKLKPELVLPNPDDQTERVESLGVRVEGHTGRLKDLERKIENLVDQLQDAADKSLRTRYESRIIELEAEKGRVAEELKADEMALRDADFDARSFREWKKGLAELKEALGKQEGDVRLATRIHFRQFIERIECFTRGHVHAWDGKKRAGDDIVEYAEALIEEVRMPKALRAEFGEFLADLLKRRMSKEGRFVRVHFKTGIWVDLVPAKSIASGMQYGAGLEPKDGKTWRKVVPDIQQLLNEFRSRKPKVKKI